MAESCIVSSVATGMCYGHTPPIPMIGTVSTGSSLKNITNFNSGRISDVIIGHCGHGGVIVTGNDSVLVEHQCQARVGDSFTGIFSGVITTGGSNHITG